MTLSARNSTDCGIVRSRAFAALRLMMNSNVFGCSTGRLAGFAPFRISHLQYWPDRVLNRRQVNWTVFPALTYESEVGLSKPSNVGKDRCKICIPDAKPGSKGSPVLIHRRGRYPTPACAAPLIRIVRTVGG